MKIEINHRNRNEKKNDYMDTKQHTTKKTNGSTMKSMRKFKNTFSQITVKTQPYKIHGLQQNQS